MRRFLRKPRDLAIPAFILAVSALYMGCDLALYDPDLAQSARIAQDLSLESTVTISDWDINDEDGDVLVPFAWYPDALSASSGYLIARDSMNDELVIARVDNGSVASGEFSLGLRNQPERERWDAWIIPIDPVLQEQYAAANPDLPPRTPPLIVARFNENELDGVVADVYGITRDQSFNGLIVTDLHFEIEDIVQVITGSANTPLLQSVQVAPYAPGGDTNGGGTADVAGATLQALVRDIDTGQTGSFIFGGDGLAFVDWIDFFDSTGLVVGGIGGAFIMPSRTDGNRPTLIRHGTLPVGTDRGDVISFKDDDFTDAPWRTFIRPVGGSLQELPTAIPVSSVTNEGVFRSVRRGSGQLQGFVELLNGEAPRTTDWSTLWYAGPYPTEAGQSGNPAAFESHRSVDVYTQVGLSVSITGDAIIEAATYTD